MSRYAVHYCGMEYQIEAEDKKGATLHAIVHFNVPIKRQGCLIIKPVDEDQMMKNNEKVNLED